MPYTPTVWVNGDLMTAAKMNNLETQYTQAYTDGYPDTLKYSGIHRQTVIEGAVSSADGLADFLTGSGSALTAFATASTSEPLILSFASGNSTFGGLDYTAKLTTDTTWAGLMTNSTNHLYFDRSTAGVITADHTIIAPQYNYVFNDNISSLGYSAFYSLLHFDGAAGSTVTTDEFGATWTNFGAAALSSTAFKFGTASLSLPGSTDTYVQNTSITSLGNGAWTLEGWFYLTSASSVNCILANNGPYGISINEEPLTGHMTIFLASSTTADDIANNSSGATTITHNAWHHWAMTYNSSTYKLWIDGALDLSVISTLTVNSALGGINLGLFGFGSVDTFAGYQDEFRMTKGEALYTAPFTPSTAAFLEGVHFYDLNKNKMYFGDPTSWTEVNRVFAGEAITSTAAVTTVRNVPLKGKKIITTAALAVSQIQSFDHGFGFIPLVDVVLLNLAGNIGYLPGDEVPVFPNYYDGASVRAASIAVDATTVKSITGTAAIAINNKNTATLTDIDYSRWAFKFYLSRPFETGVV